MTLRVAAYCRVSTDREDQANSLQSQKSYFRSYIESRGDWDLAEVYADEGISGTSTKHREAFNRMIKDAEQGRFQLVLTKEVSRFARNTVDTLGYTRQLKNQGVGVIFINDNIDTRDNDGELRLTIMASVAQEESRKTSERVKWGQKRRMEAGVVFGNDSTYGFCTKGGALSVREDEARVIRHIYQKFLNEGKGTHIIARELYEEGVPPPRTATGKWSCVMIRRILRNEKYVGDLKQKKFVTVDFLSHKKVENRGREEPVYLRDHHEAVVDRATWEGVQEELARRNTQRGDGSKYSNRYWCSGKIRCGACGSRFVPRTTKRPNGAAYRAWGCHSRVHYGNWKRNGQGDYVGCDMRMLNEKTLTACVSYVLRQLNLDYDAILAELVEDIGRVQNASPDEMGIGRLQAKQAEVEQRKVKAMDAFFNSVISEQELLKMKMYYDKELAKLDAQMRCAEDMARVMEAQKDGLDHMVGTIRTGLDSSEAVFRETIEWIKVFEDYIDIKVNDVPGTFRIRYTTSGKKENYTTTITDCEILQT